MTAQQLWFRATMESVFLWIAREAVEDASASRLCRIERAHGVS